MEQNSPPNLVRVLLVDDDEEDFIIIKHLFSSMNSLQTKLEWVSTSEEGIAKINEHSHDAYLIDYRIDALTGIDILKEVNALERLEPFILLTGVGDSGIERESLQMAASDYLVKKNLTSDTLARALYYALGRKEQERQKIEELVAINKTKDEFISIASHQLRTPATAVKQYVAMVLDGLADDITDKQRTLLVKAYENNERQLSIINDLLKVAQIDAGSYELSHKKVNVHTIVKKAVEDLHSLFDRKNQKIEFKGIDAIAEVDENAIRMIVDNLIENASKYSYPNTTTAVLVEHDQPFLKITVADNGVGVKSPERLFKKFSRIENELSTEVGGTGIGLYWAQSIARMHGGDLSFEPNTPKGSRFIIRLPSVK